MCRFLPVFCLLCVLLAGHAARAQHPEPPLPDRAIPDPPPPADARQPSVGPTHRVSAFASVFGQLAPTKGGYSAGLTWRYTFKRDANILLDGLYVEPQVEVFANPLLPSYRLQLTVVPIAFLRLVVAYTNYFFVGWDNDFGLGLTFPDRRAPFDPATLRARRGEDVRQWAQRIEIRPVLQLQLGALVLFSEAELALWLIDGPDDYFYDPLYDTLLQRGGVERVLSNRTAIGAEAWRGAGEARLILALSNHVVRAWGSRIIRDRLGVAMLLTPWDRLGPMARPTVFIQPGVTLQHPHRRFDPFLEVYFLAHFDIIAR